MLLSLEKRKSDWFFVLCVHVCLVLSDVVGSFYGERYVPGKFERNLQNIEYFVNLAKENNVHFGVFNEFGFEKLRNMLNVYEEEWEYPKNLTDKFNRIIESCITVSVDLFQNVVWKLECVFFPDFAK